MYLGGRPSYRQKSTNGRDSRLSVSVIRYRRAEKTSIAVMSILPQTASVEAVEKCCLSYGSIVRHASTRYPKHLAPNAGFGLCHYPKKCRRNHSLRLGSRTLADSSRS